MLATRARALLDGRLSPSLDDVVALAHPVLRHRMALNFSARAEGVELAGVIAGFGQAHLKATPGSRGARQFYARRRWAPHCRPLLVASERVAATVCPRAFTGAAGLARAIVSGSSGPTSRATHPAASIGGNPPNRPGPMFGRPSGEAAQTVHLWRDSSASMHWRSGAAVPEKVERGGVTASGDRVPAAARRGARAVAGPPLGGIDGRDGGNPAGEPGLAPVRRPPAPCPPMGGWC